MAYEELPGLLHHDGELFVCECGNSEMRVEIDTNPLRFWCKCGDYYTEESVATRYAKLVPETVFRSNKVTLKMPSGTYFVCNCGSDEFWPSEDTEPQQFKCRCAHVYHAAKNFNLEVESALHRRSG